MSMYQRDFAGRILALLSLILALATLPLPAGEIKKAPDNAELWEIIQKQQREIDALKRKLNMVEDHVATTSDIVEQIADVPAEPSTSWARTHLGGYGELHYNNLNNQLSSGKDKREIDFHRFVLFFGHEFSDRVRFQSEVEIEHALVVDSDDGSGPGEVELEQAFIDLDVTGQHTARAGLFLIPVGILNETHEPPTFFGVERNPVESNIIPTTWWEAGLGFYGEIAPGLNYDLAYTSGLAVDDSYGIRGGRQKVAKAKATDGAVTGRLKWVRPGLELAATVQYQEDLTQDGANGAVESSAATLAETHLVLSRGPFAIRALYARWDLDAAAAEATGRDVQEGWYVEPSLKLPLNIGVFCRFSEWDNNGGDSKNSRMQQFDIGMNWWPHENVVLKADYQDQQTPAGASELDGFNLGVGYQF